MPPKLKQSRLTASLPPNGKISDLKCSYLVRRRIGGRPGGGRGGLRRSSGFAIRYPPSRFVEAKCNLPLSSLTGSSFVARCPEDHHTRIEHAKAVVDLSQLWFHQRKKVFQTTHSNLRFPNGLMAVTQPSASGVVDQLLKFVGLPGMEIAEQNYSKVVKVLN